MDSSIATPDIRCEARTQRRTRLLRWPHEHVIAVTYKNLSACHVDTDCAGDAHVMGVSKTDASRTCENACRGAGLQLSGISNPAELTVSDGEQPHTLVGDSHLVIDDWISRLSTPGRAYDEAVSQLHELLLRAARSQVGRMKEAHMLGRARREEIVHSAADDAAMSVLSKLSTFEGRSAFTTWAYKFGILQAANEVRRDVWRDREINLDDIPEQHQKLAPSPETYAEGHDLAHAVREGLRDALTPHQRRVAIAVLIDEVPIDVLAERLGINRNALYKTLHDARQRLRAHLSARDFLLPMTTPKEVTK